MTARDDILAAIRAIDRAAPRTQPHAYRRSAGLSASERVELFRERVSDYRAEVRRVDASGVAAAATEICSGLRIGIPEELPGAWRPGGCELVLDDALPTEELDRLDGAVTGCTVAVAETGTIVLAAGGGDGRRALTLVPDLHVCVVREDQIVATIPEALAVVAPLVRDARRPLTMVSGPSATSDIELSRVEGVHGPRTLVVILAEGD